MQPNDAGLPLPGRELDAAMWGLLGHKIVKGDDGVYRYEVVQKVVKVVYEDGACPYSRVGWLPVPEVSTTHAFFQVMEAMEKKGCIWDNWEKGVEICRQLHVSVSNELMRLVTVNVHRNSYPNREAAYAHAVCCCAWKAMGGENAQQS